MNSELELLVAAHEKQTIQVEFDIEIGDAKVPVILTAGDRFEIAQIQADIIQELVLTYRKKGWENEPINDSEWETDLARFTNPDVRKRMEEQKPGNLAQQQAERHARIRTIKELIPRFLKKSNGDKFLTTPKELEKFQEMIGANPALMQILATKYTELLQKETEIGEAVKNSSEQKSSENGSSQTPLLEDTKSGLSQEK